MTDTTPLSPAAQAVLDAVLQKSNLSPTVSVAAAALRAVTDNCIDRMWSVEMDDLYRELYAIAAELDGAQ